MCVCVCVCVSSESFQDVNQIFPWWRRVIPSILFLNCIETEVHCDGLGSKLSSFCLSVFTTGSVSLANDTKACLALMNRRD